MPQVVFGHCISDCGGTGSNTNAAQAVKIMADLKTYNSGAFSCNGGAFFWVSLHDTGGAWSDAVVGEVVKTAGCSSAQQPVTSTPTAQPTAVIPVTTTTSTTTTTTIATTIATTPATTTTSTTTVTTSKPTVKPTTASNCPAVTAQCGASTPCAAGFCCSQWGVSNVIVVEILMINTFVQ